MYRRKNSDYRCRFIQFSQKFKQNSIELFRSLHHGCMTTFVNKMQFAVRDQFAKLLAYKRRRNSIIISPDEQGGLFYLADFFSQFVPDDTLAQGNDLDCLNA